MYSSREILYFAFRNNQTFTIATGRDKTRIERLIDYSIRHAEKYGKVYCNNFSSALIIDTAIKVSRFNNLVQLMKLVLKSLRFNAFKINKKEKLTQTVHKEYNIPHGAIYLWYLGTHPEFQRQGWGSKLLTEILFDYQGKTVILQTSEEANVRWYKKFGFDLYHIEIFDSMKIYFLKKDGKPIILMNQNEL